MRIKQVATVVTRSHTPKWWGIFAESSHRHLEILHQPFRLGFEVRLVCTDHWALLCWVVGKVHGFNLMQLNDRQFPLTAPEVSGLIPVMVLGGSLTELFLSTSKTSRAVRLMIPRDVHLECRAQITLNGIHQGIRESRLRGGPNTPQRQPLLNYGPQLAPAATRDEPTRPTTIP